MMSKDDSVANDKANNMGKYKNPGETNEFKS